MSYRWITAGVIAVLALAAGGFSYFCFHQPMPAASEQLDSLLWVRQEFGLSGEKLARVEAMHEAYELTCADHCLAIAGARKELRRLRMSAASPEEIAAATARCAVVDAGCIESTREHIRQVAAVIGGEGGRRYLSIVLPRVGAYDHSSPVTLDMEKANAHDRPARK